MCEPKTVRTEFGINNKKGSLHCSKLFVAVITDTPRTHCGVCPGYGHDSDLHEGSQPCSLGTLTSQQCLWSFPALAPDKLYRSSLGINPGAGHGGTGSLQQSRGWG